MDLMREVLVFQNDRYQDVCLTVADPCPDLSTLRAPAYLPTLPYNSRHKAPATAGVLFFRAVGLGPGSQRAGDLGELYKGALKGSGLLPGCPINVYSEGQGDGTRFIPATFIGCFIFPFHYEASMGLPLVGDEKWTRLIWLAVTTRSEGTPEVGLVPLSSLHSVLLAPASSAPAIEVEMAESVMIAGLMEAEASVADGSPVMATKVHQSRRIAVVVVVVVKGVVGVVVMAVVVLVIYLSS